MDVANRRGLVRAMVNLDESQGKAIFSSKLAAYRVKWKTIETDLLVALGSDASSAGYWNNGLGQIGVHVNAKGLSVLLSSPKVQSVGVDPTTTQRRRVHDLDGSVDSVASLIRKQGFADVELVLNHNFGEFDLSRDGKTIFQSTPDYVAELKTRLNKLSKSSLAKGLAATTAGQDPILEKLASLSAQAIPNLQPTLQTRIDYATFLALCEYEDIRAMHPIGFVDGRAAAWSTEPLELTSALGSVEVLISLRSGINYTPRLGYVSNFAKENQANAHKRAFADIFVGAGVKMNPLTNATDFSIGILHVRLSHAELLRLYADADPRILSVAANKPIATPQLVNSTGLINLPNYWASGFRGAGQTIVVLDTGIRKAHQFFAAGTTTKVVYEACYGTNFIGYRSVCLNADFYGDSPPGLIGSGEPPNAALCSLVATNGGTCGHGTHVAGIAAGRSGPGLPSGLQGVAPDANLVSVVVTSYKPTGEMAIFPVSVLAGLNLVASATAANTVNNPLIVNMSLGGLPLKNGACGAFNDVDLTPAIQNLTSRGVPVVAATGNDNGLSSAGALGIGWPSCIATTIKVGAVTNDSNGLEVSNYSNLGIPGNYGSDVILLAPGGGNPVGVPRSIQFANNVISAGIASNTQVVPLSGTSMAAPHVAGFYALLKSFVASNPTTYPNGLSVADLTAYVVASASVPVTAYGQTYRRIRLP